MDVAMRVNPQDKMINAEHPMENRSFVKLLREMLPPSVAWRQKSNLVMVLDTVGLIL
jgi:asparagine synthase (glutamine-hydrolysing)